MVSIETQKCPNGTYEAYIDCGRERTGVEVVSWAYSAVELGAGEIMVTSIDREGTGMGYGCSLTRQIAEAVPVLVIACGGAGTCEHVRQVIEDGRADAVSLVLMVHYTLLTGFSR